MTTYGELLTELLKIYNRVIDELISNPDIYHSQQTRDQYLRDNDVECGICFCALAVFKVDIFDTMFSKIFTYGNSYLCSRPQYSSYEECLSFLEKRVDRMNEMLPKYLDIPIGK